MVKFKKIKGEQIMKEETKIIKKSKKLLVELALRTSYVEANSTCPYFGYQEEEPEQVRKLRKF